MIVHNTHSVSSLCTVMTDENKKENFILSHTAHDPSGPPPVSRVSVTPRGRAARFSN